MLENMQEGVVLSNTDGVITWSNPAFDQVFGYERGE